MGSGFVCSWSGGKDCCLAYLRALDAGLEPVALVTMLTEGGVRTRSHGLPLDVIEAQAAALGLPLVTRATSVVVEAPAFSRRLELGQGKRTLRDGVWFLDVSLAERARPRADSGSN